MMSHHRREREYIMNKNKKQVLIVTNTVPVKNGLGDWVKENITFAITQAATDEKAIELFQQHLFDFVVIDQTSGDIDHKKLDAILPILHRDALCIRYKGESSQQIDNMIRVEESRKKIERIKRLLVIDSYASDEWKDLPPFSDN